MYIGMDIHKRYAQVAVMNETGRIVEETRVEDSRKEGGISKQGSAHLRWVLVQFTMSAVHTVGDEYLGRFFNRLDKRKHSMVARVATARKLLVPIYYMLDREGVYDPPGVSS